MSANRYAVFRASIVLGFIAIILVILLPRLGNLVPRDTVKVSCVVGSEKSNFLRNPQVQTIMRQTYGVEVTFTAMGSIEQASTNTAGLDCLWPSNTTALDIFKERNQTAFTSGSISSEIVFNSPIVLYSWKPIVDTLVQEGLVTQNGDTYQTDTAALISLMTAAAPPQWSDLGVNNLYGDFNIITTDPTRSNSGNIFYGLMANMLVGGDVATSATMQTVLPAIKTYYDRQGYMEESSGILFERYINTGIGANPIIANYESVLIEFSIANQQNLELIRDQLRIIYPTPTVWSAHPLIALTANGRLLMTALRDTQLQKIAWEQHGFRSGLTGVTNDPTIFNIAGIPQDVNSVIPLPRADALIEMLDYLGN